MQVERLANSNRPNHYRKRWLPPQFAAMALNVFMWTWIREHGAPLPVKSKFREYSLAGMTGTDHGAIYRVLRMKLGCSKEIPKLHRIKLICEAARRKVNCPRSHEFFDDLLAVARVVEQETPNGYWDGKLDSLNDATSGADTSHLFSALHAMPVSQATRNQVRQILERFVLLYHIERMSGTFDEHVEGGLSIERNELGVALGSLLQFVEPMSVSGYRTVRGYGVELLLMPVKAWAPASVSCYDDDVASHALSWEKGAEPWATPSRYADHMV